MPARIDINLTRKLREFRRRAERAMRRAVDKTMRQAAQRGTRVMKGHIRDTTMRRSGRLRGGARWRYSPYRSVIGGKLQPIFPGTEFSGGQYGFIVDHLLRRRDGQGYIGLTLNDPIFANLTDRVRANIFVELRKENLI